MDGHTISVQAAHRISQAEREHRVVLRMENQVAKPPERDNTHQHPKEFLCKWWALIVQAKDHQQDIITQQKNACTMGFGY